MVEEVNFAEWDHTAHILALLSNIHRGKGRPRQPIDFHPFRKNAPKKSISRSELHQLRDAFPVYYVTLPPQNDTSKSN
jgi:hypothetical protein